MPKQDRQAVSCGNALNARRRRAQNELIAVGAWQLLRLDPISIIERRD